MGIYVFFWLLITSWLGLEYWALNGHLEYSTLSHLQSMGYLAADMKLLTKPGGTVSLWLGWIGFGLMIIMNLYSLRKRTGALGQMGSLRSWLNFHVFCGLLGPSLILFHSNLKARGIVGISFWSMIISFSSGVIGRYFYLQLLGKKADYDKAAEKWIERLNKVLESSKTKGDEALMKNVLKAALRHAGCNMEGTSINPFFAVFCSLIGDIRMYFTDPRAPVGWPPQSRLCLAQYALNMRRSLFLGPFQKIMGLWHDFHFPFAVFMYIAAVIHVISSLIFHKSV
ncbi:MAG: hypothetical protein AB7F86_10415 [Bdellovibrionales bacterium]